MKKVYQVIPYNGYDEDKRNIKTFINEKDALNYKRYLELDNSMYSDYDVDLKEIELIDIPNAEKHIKDLEGRIEKGEISDYTVKTFSTLCGKVIEHYSMIGNGKDMEYLMIMKKILNLEEVQKLTIEDLKELNETKEN